jgi:hypothetical protein
MPKQEDGCATFMRRTFLFLVGLAGAKFVHDYFSVNENQKKVVALLETFDREVNTRLRQGSQQKNSTPSHRSPDTNTLPNHPIVRSQSQSDRPQIFKNPSPPQTPSKLDRPQIFQNPTPPKPTQPIQLQRRTINGVPFYLLAIDLNDPETFITVGLANNAPQANDAQTSYGDEAFASMVARYRAAVVANGTFFSKDAQKRVMGNLVAGGKFLKFCFCRKSSLQLWCNKRSLVLDFLASRT